MQIVSKYLIAGLICCTAGFQAQATSAASVDISAPADAGMQDVLDPGQVLPDENLDGYTGRQDTRVDQLNMQVTEVRNDGQVEGNVLSAVGSSFTTGVNSIDQGSFAGASGMVTVIQNSGNQVLIQNDMVLNLFVK